VIGSDCLPCWVRHIIDHLSPGPTPGLFLCLRQNAQGAELALIAPIASLPTTATTLASVGALWPSTTVGRRGPLWATGAALILSAVLYPKHAIPKEEAHRRLQRSACQPHSHPVRPYTSSSAIPISASKPDCAFGPLALALLGRADFCRRRSVYTGILRMRTLLGGRSVRCSQRGRRLRPLALHLEQHLAIFWIIRPSR
jgi:hypothetical protein